MKIHNCEKLKKLQEEAKGDRHAGGYCSYDDWEIKEGWISVNDEYGIDVEYCPFCGVKFENKD